MTACASSLVLNTLQPARAASSATAAAARAAAVWNSGLKAFSTKTSNAIVACRGVAAGLEPSAREAGLGRFRLAAIGTRAARALWHPRAAMAASENKAPRRSPAIARSATSRARPSRARRRPTPRAAEEGAAAPIFVVQKHWASRLHYDFRLEHDGVLLSWAVPKGPSYDPSKMQMAIHVEDHPLDYASFEGTIPPRQYGAGTVIVWDRGTWEPEGDPRDGMAKGKLVFRLHGEKLAGLWELVRIAKPGDKQDAWMLFKKKDAWARPLAEYDVITALPDSVVARPLGPVEEREPRGAAASPLAATALAPRPADMAAALPRARCRRGSSRSSRRWPRLRRPATG
jgi:DNA ligase D-like protein (predicted 3'-phosphoesterase)